MTEGSNPEKKAASFWTLSKSGPLEIICSYLEFTLFDGVVYMFVEQGCSAILVTFAVEVA